MRIKDTLNLGKTKFKMRGNLPVREAQWQKEWDEADLYNQRLKINEGHPRFDLHDGPPFANGNIHLGHALNKISKDIIVRFKNMDGYYAPYVPGWDTHGLPVEQQLAKKGIKRKTMDTYEYREMCKEFALKQVARQKSDFKRLGIMADWDNPYITLNPSFESEEIRIFGQMFEQGYIYKGKKPVYWSPSSESTLAEAEVEYHDIKSPSMYIAFPVRDGKGILSEKNTYFVIWTTTPWTIPSNLGITVNPKFNYSVIKVNDKKYVIEDDRLEAVADTLDWKDYEVVQHLKGVDMDRMVAKHPLYDQDSLVMNALHVTADDGTGLVHTAPGFGEDDYNVGKRYDLPIFSPIDNQGKFTDEVPDKDLVGVFYDKANKIVSDKLKESGSLLKLSFFTHSYPHDWRTKKPVIYRATTQWFASISEFREQILNEINNAKFIPDWGKTRLYNMIKDRGDWVISRQRAWGVPLPIFYAEDGTAIVNSETINHVADLFGKEGSNIWFKKSAKELLPEGFTSEHSPNGQFTKEKDILDVWFDSGSSWAAVMKNRPNLSLPADLNIEGSDQYRGWFNSSLITAVATTGHAPYKEILSQGFVLDDKGHKMSKSLGNVILPSDVIKQMGAEIIRLWVAGADTSSDVAVSQDILKQASESYRKIRNTMRFMIANTADFNYKHDAVTYEKMTTVNQYLEVKLNELLTESLKAYNDFDFNLVYKKVFSFISNDLSAFYLDFAKDILYICPENSNERRAMQTVIYDVLVKLTKLLTPILPHTMEEIWSYLKEDEDYVQLAEMPIVENYDNQSEVLTNMAEFMKVRSDVLKALEEARTNKIIGKSFEAHVKLVPTAETKELFSKLNFDIRQVLIVSELTILDKDNLKDSESFNTGKILIEHAEGETCVRCRRITTNVGSDSNFPELCADCAKIVTDNFPEAKSEGLEK